MSSGVVIKREVRVNTFRKLGQYLLQSKFQFLSGEVLSYCISHHAKKVLHIVGTSSPWMFERGSTIDLFSSKMFPAFNVGGNCYQCLTKKSEYIVDTLIISQVILTTLVTGSSPVPHCPDKPGFKMVSFLFHESC